MTKCDKCRAQAVIYQRYSGMHLCREHMQADVIRRARERLRKSGIFGGARRILIGLDGERRSATVASILLSLFSRRRDIEILAAFVCEDEKATPLEPEARAIAQRLEIPFILLRPTSIPLRSKYIPLVSTSIPLKPTSIPQRPASLEEFGQAEQCRASQVRHHLIRAAMQNGADTIATGECLDDLALEVFMGCLGNGIPDEACLGCPPDPKCESYRLENACWAQGASDCEMVQGIFWIMPLSRVPKREVRLFALFGGLGLDRNEGQHLGDGRDRLREQAGALLSGFEARHPGTRYSLLRGYERGMCPGFQGKAFK